MTVQFRISKSQLTSQTEGALEFVSYFRRYLRIIAFSGRFRFLVTNERRF